MPTPTPNMNLLQPTVNVDTGLVWEQSMNANSAVLDGHDHSPGSGVQIPPSGLNINAALPMNGNQLTATGAVVFSNQTSLATLQAVYTINGDLYFNDSASNVIRITSGGTVNATSSGITSGTASASFVSSVLVVNSASNTPANIQGGSVLLGNNVAASKFLTLAPPSAMAANFALTLPPIPGSTSFLTVDTSGNIVGTNATAQGITRSNLVAVGQQISASCGSFTTHNTTLTPVTNLSVTITTTGRPVIVFCSGDGTDGGLSFGNSFYAVSGYAEFALLQGAAVIQRQEVTAGENFPGTCLYLMRALAAGTYTFSVQARNPSGNTAGANQLSLYAYEL